MIVVVVVVVVVECYCFLIYIIVAPPQPGPPHFYCVKVMFFIFSGVSLQSEQGSSGVITCCCRFRRNARPDSTFAKKHLFHEMQFRRNARPDLPPLNPLGSPLGVLGSPLGPLGSPVFLLPVSLI